MKKKTNAFIVKDVESPYEIWQSLDGEWEWRVLKKWQLDDSKPYAKWYCAVKSPFTRGEWEYGDEYVNTIKNLGIKVYG